GRAYRGRGEPSTGSLRRVDSSEDTQGDLAEPGSRASSRAAARTKPAQPLDSRSPPREMNAPERNGSATGPRGERELAARKAKHVGLRDVIDEQLDAQGEMFADHVSDQFWSALRPLLPMAVGVAFVFVGAVLWGLAVWQVVQWASVELGGAGLAIVVVAACHLVLAGGLFGTVRIRRRLRARQRRLSPPSTAAISELTADEP